MADQTILVQQLYVAYFSRPADPAGLKYWSDVLNTNPNGLQEISKAFSASAEYKAEYSQNTNEQVIAAIYQNLFGRQAESAGVQYWADLMNSGKITIDNAVTQIAGGARTTDKFAYDAKVAVSKTFTEHLNLDVEIKAYTGAHSNEIAISYIAGVRDLNSAANAVDPAAIDRVIEKIVNEFTPSASSPTAGGSDSVELVGAPPQTFDMMY